MDTKELLKRFLKTRENTVSLCEPLELEDYVVQPTSFVSPPKWHLGHTTWFFQNILSQVDCKPPKKFFNFSTIFNSYYKGLGEHWKQDRRGDLSRPTVKEVLEFREHINELVEKFLIEGKFDQEQLSLIEVGINHEEQHQELLLMDIKYILFQNPSFPAYRDHKESKREFPKKSAWETFEEGVIEIGACYESQVFLYDNETPRHKKYSYPFEISKNLVTNGEYLEFILSRGYEFSEHWLSLGWDFVSKESINAPLYWVKKEGDWFEFTLHGLQKLELNKPVSNVSYFEADAFAKWRGCRLPREHECELLINKSKPDLAFDYESVLKEEGSLLWSWTSSAYEAYPGFKPFKGFAKEYNGKFMCQQYVLRGGSFATLEEHFRPTYRNFYFPEQRWMFSGIRLSRDIN